MSKIYIEQTDLTLLFLAGKTLNASDIAKVEYASPKGVRGFFNATIFNASKGEVVFNVNDTTSEFQSLGAGTYTFWLNITDGESGLISIGEPTKIKINNKGE